MGMAEQLAKAERSLPPKNRLRSEIISSPAPRCPPNNKIKPNTKGKVLKLRALGEADVVLSILSFITCSNHNIFSVCFCMHWSGAGGLIELSISTELRPRLSATQLFDCNDIIKQERTIFSTFFQIHIFS